LVAQAGCGGSSSISSHHQKLPHTQPIMCTALLGHPHALQQHVHVLLITQVCTILCWLQGYHDAEYKARRVMIANIARQHEM
jgi:hypothetical protein